MNLALILVPSSFGLVSHIGHACGMKGWRTKAARNCKINAEPCQDVFNQVIKLFCSYRVDAREGKVSAIGIANNTAPAFSLN